MTRLETRYRRLLRLLPAWYRAEREQEMVEVFLDDRAARARDTGELDDEYGWPGWGEAAAVAGLAVRTRVGGPGDPPGPRATGAVVRAAGTGAVLLSAGGAGATAIWWVVAALIGPSEAADNLAALVRPAGAGQWHDAVLLVLGLCWLPAWTALSAGRLQLARILGILATVPPLSSIASALVDGAMTAAALTLAAALMPVGALVLLRLGFHRDAPPPAVAHPWSLLAGVTVGLLAFAVLVPVTRTTFHPDAAVLLVAALAVLATRRVTAAGGLAVLAGIAVVGGLLELAALEVGRGGAAVTVALGAAALLVATVVVRRRDRAASATPG
jgi:hypothetical protein